MISVVYSTRKPNKQFQDYNNKSSYKFNKYFNRYMNMLGDIYI